MSARFTGTPSVPTWDTEETYDWLCTDEGTYTEIEAKLAKLSIYDNCVERLGAWMKATYGYITEHWDIDPDNVDWDTIALWFMDEDEDEN